MNHVGQGRRRRAVGRRPGPDADSRLTGSNALLRRSAGGDHSSSGYGPRTLTGPEPASGQPPALQQGRCA